ncbi:SusD/RagB family nutrient-binding outer membrane lipoprotein [Algoriphagus sp. H41]|uniref:SusD/RagB family nutrient-binding outer membrane lipoprotein n=1 Tax=Algoriphagus oliviformis TaxID=2811231 RepID=A0ABS3C5U1_9BACT|nr:SusD/RagB family nutrient-binding outer membrane lipoprotein [Algoriphagus oliviformis]MBN7812373.1 SusD/RagB family nutrient-binding outer membrane lipoprotein [Algoriphagus oliviformis]
MRKINKLVMGVLVGSMLLTSCSEFGDMNTDPNRPSNPLTSGLLTGAQRSVSSVVGDATSVLYAQHLSEKQYTESSRYQTVYFDFNGFYSGPLMNLQRIIELNTNEATKGDVLSSGSNENQIAVARILKAYFFASLTDRWGELPYTEALQGELDFSPSYDSQEFIYTDLMKELKEAAAQINPATAAVEGDLLFDGNMESWRRFANSLRMILALRMSDVAPQAAQTNFTEAYSGGILLTNFMYPYLGEANNQNPWYARYLTRVDYAISDTMYDYMMPLGDPRLAVYADPAANTGTIESMPYGVSNAEAGSITNAEVSYLGGAIREQSAELPIVTVAQLEFSLAEAALKGWISESAEEHYLKAIEASFRQYGVYNKAAYDAFVAQPEVAWSEAAGMERIGYQKWVALFLQGFEAWAEWRRLDYPVLTPAKDALNASKEIPVRQAYPTSERDINTDNYQEAVSRQGEDGLDTKLWWDVK